MIETITINQIREWLFSYRKECAIALEVDKQVKNLGYYKDAINDLDRLRYEILYTSGQLINYPPYGVLAKQSLLSNYYRGERCRYGSSKPTIHRYAPENKNEQFLYYFISNMRITAFTEFIKQLNIVKGWKSSIVLFEALAQHYGIATDFLDITNSLETALFFACCKYENEKWRPLEKSDFINEQTKYGVIFKAKRDELFGSNRLLPIGFQPLMRCHRQHAYILAMDNQEDLYSDRQFVAYQFEHDENFCKEIFELSLMGEKVFPNYESLALSKAVSCINEAKCFSEKIFDMTYSFIYNFPYIDSFITKNELILWLNRNGVEINDTPIISQTHIDKINNTLLPYPEDDEDLNSVFRTALDIK